MSQFNSDLSKAKRPHKRVVTSLLEYDEESKKMVPAKSMTDGSFKDETDINRIIKRQLPVPTEDSMIFADTTVMADFQTQSDMVAAVHEQFDLLPANLRYRFENDPAKLLDFMRDPENVQESIELGLRPKPKPDDKKAPEEDARPPKPKPEPEPTPPPSKKDSTVDS